MSRPEFGTLDTPKTPIDAALVVAIDPGKSTGWAVWSQDRSKPFLNHGQGPLDTVLEPLQKLLTRLTPEARAETVMVIERFVIPPRLRGGSADAETTLHVIGACQLIAKQQMVKVVTQLPGERQVVSQWLLRRWNWDNPKSPITGKDARSAVKHLGSFLLQKGAVPTLASMVR